MSYEPTPLSPSAHRPRPRRPSIKSPRSRPKPIRTVSFSSDTKQHDANFQLNDFQEAVAARIKNEGPRVQPEDEVEEEQSTSRGSPTIDLRGQREDETAGRGSPTIDLRRKPQRIPERNVYRGVERAVSPPLSAYSSSSRSSSESRSGGETQQVPGAWKADRSGSPTLRFYPSEKETKGGGDEAVTIPSSWRRFVGSDQVQRSGSPPLSSYGPSNTSANDGSDSPRKLYISSHQGNDNRSGSPPLSSCTTSNIEPQCEEQNISDEDEGAWTVDLENEGVYKYSPVAGRIERVTSDMDYPAHLRSPPGSPTREQSPSGSYNRTRSGSPTMPSSPTYRSGSPKLNPSQRFPPEDLSALVYEDNSPSRSISYSPTQSVSPTRVLFPARYRADSPAGSVTSIRSASPIHRGASIRFSSPPLHGSSTGSDMNYSQHLRSSTGSVSYSPQTHLPSRSISYSPPRTDSPTRSISYSPLRASSPRSTKSYTRPERNYPQHLRSPPGSVSNSPPLPEIHAPIESISFSPPRSTSPLRRYNTTSPPPHRHHHTSQHRSPSPTGSIIDCRPSSTSTHPNTTYPSHHTHRGGSQTRSEHEQVRAAGYTSSSSNVARHEAHSPSQSRNQEEGPYHAMCGREVYKRTTRGEKIYGRYRASTGEWLSCRFFDVKSGRFEYVRKF